MKPILTACAVAALCACSPQARHAENTTTAPSPPPAAPVKPAQTTAPAGAYKLDPPHTSVLFRVSHMGFSRYTAGFSKVDARLNFDPLHPEAMTVEATIDPRSLDIPSPPPGFRAQLLGPEFFDVAKYPQITFRSTKVDLTGPNTARVTGDLTLHGVTRPIVLETKFNGGYPPGGIDPSGARIGFSARGTFKRSDFGMGFGVPAPGSNMGVGDEVRAIIETELTSPPAKPA